MADYRSGVKLIASVGTDNELRSGHPQANLFGRVHPAPTVGTFTVLGQVAQDLFSEDEAGGHFTGLLPLVPGFTAGIAYDAGQLWTRVVRSAAGDGSDSTDDWIAVPDTLPAGYTARTERNLRPGTKITTSAAMTLISVGSPFFVGYQSHISPIYSPTNFIRSADSIAAPASQTNDLGRTFQWGPINRNSDVGFLLDDSTNLVLVEGLAMKHPGFRNIRLWHRITNTFYNNVDTDFKHTTSLNGSIVAVTAKADYTFNASLDVTQGQWYKIYDLGPYLAPIGTQMDFTYDSKMEGSLAPGIGGGPIPPGNQPAVKTNLFLSPRLDIPLPWTATSGNLIAPGGFLS